MLKTGLKTREEKKSLSFFGPNSLGYVAEGGCIRITTLGTITEVLENNT